jgi:multiple sugar transport system substrate-binding protein
MGFRTAVGLGRRLGVEGGLRRAVIAVVAGAVALGASGCMGGDDDSSGDKAAATYDGKPVTITLWTGFSDRELGVIKGVTEDFHKKNPKITVKVLGGVDDDKIIAAARGGNSPDVAHSFSTDNTGAFCSSGAWIKLQPYMDRDGLSASAFPESVQQYTKFEGNQCTLPMLADVYGFFYNKDLLAKAGINEPPKTFSELAADAKKLTQRKSDGTIEVAGYVPTWGFYENQAAHYAPQFNAQWTDDQGKSSLSSDPGWKKMLTWSKNLVDWYGYDNLVRFQAGAGDEYSAQNAFERGKIAMMIDGEYRTAFIENEHPDLNYGTAPMVVDDDQPDLHGGGYVTGSIIGIPKGAKNPAAAWELVKYLAYDEHALATLSNGLRNVPTTAASLHSSELKPNANFETFLKIFPDEHSATNPITAAGAAYQEAAEEFFAKYQTNKVPDLQAGLEELDKQIDDQLAQITQGQTP